MKQNDFMILLDVASREMDSVALVSILRRKMIDGYSTIDWWFLRTLSDVLARADFKLSFQFQFDFPYQLMHV